MSGPTPTPGAFGADLLASSVLWKRDVLKFFRHPARIAGAIAQPLIFWVVLGGGLSGSFQVPGATEVDYLLYFFPGVLMMMVLFSAIFGTISIIEDRNEGFLQAVLVSQASRGAIVVGKVGGTATVAMVQSSLLLLFLPLAGFSPSEVYWPQLLISLSLVAMALTAVGFSLAWWLDSSQAYHALMTVLLIPAWLVSGAVFPGTAASGWLSLIMECNPLSYALLTVRHSLYGSAGIPEGLLQSGNLGDIGLAWLVLVGFCVGALVTATYLSRRHA